MKKLLVLTYYWPPAGGASVQRVAKFCKYLPEFGWQPYVVTIRNGSYSKLDNSFFRDVQYCKVFRFKSEHMRWLRAVRGLYGDDATVRQHLSFRKPSNVLRRLKNFVRDSIFVPDNKIVFYKGFVSFALQIAKNSGVNAIFATGPPFSFLLMGLKLKKSLGLPLIGDFRDPWVEGVWYESGSFLGMSKKLNRLLEKKVLYSADRIVTVFEKHEEMQNQKGARKVVLIPNGYDPDDFPKNIRRSNKFVLGYYGRRRGQVLPEPLARAVFALKDKEPELYSNLIVRIMGSSEMFEKGLAAELYNEGKLEIHGYVEHRKFITVLCEEQILLQFVQYSKRSDLLLGSKLYEYLHTGNPIMCIGGEGSDAWKLIEENNAGRCFCYEDVSGMKSYLKLAHAKWKQGQLNTGKRSFLDFERREGAKALAQVANLLI